MRRRAVFLVIAALIAIAVGLTLQVAKRKLRSNLVGSSSGSLQTINTAAVTYRQQYGAYPPNLQALGSPRKGESEAAKGSGLIDDVLASGGKSGYIFEYRHLEARSKSQSDGYEVTATPIVRKPDQAYYFTDQTGVVRMEFGRPATASSPPID